MVELLCDGKTVLCVVTNESETGSPKNLKEAPSIGGTDDPLT